MSKYWSELVRQLEPYVPGEQPQVDGLIKLNTNENPYPPSPKVEQALKASAVERLRLYPDPYSRRLQDSIGQLYGVRPEQVFIGNGSDEVLAFAFMAFFKQDRPLLYPDITYSFYPVYCQLLGITAEQIPVREDFRLALEDFPADNGGIIFPNPNAPTSMGLPLSDIEALLQRNTHSVVVVDEAYVDFGAESAVALVNQYPNLLVVQTLSKSRSLAGLRVGFAIGHEDLIDGLDRVKNSFNSYPVDQLAQTIACAAVDDREYFEQCRDKVIATRDWCTRALEDLGFAVLPSQTNFLFARPPSSTKAADLAQALREAKILVRHFGRPRIADYLRISLGTDEQMTRLVETLKTLLPPQTNG
ncbi:histidinol-phosphate transaminase [Marinimicrobium sp. ABcell2]|uniref:histidinol-phosphate transaminase n=1 Tax=Marinimicrobium sp. ABcell2 TaxID=3069751 RepID=UPI0027B161AC|nr:histidinol-phosphate transaminase [Marinimicrobium sp. ABcell2]MDQ2077604.1 histidinol-phosphate transaminase [Marinimicrobium sp. ABcell2]